MEKNLINLGIFFIEEFFSYQDLQEFFAYRLSRIF
jgi:hypothetical protein